MRTLFELGAFYVDIQKALKKKIDIITMDADLTKEFEEEMNKELVKIFG